MKKLIVFVAAIAAASLVASTMSTTPAGATVSANETILLKRDANRAEIGWSASGAFQAAGSWTTDFAVFGGGTHVFAGTVKTTETDAKGSFQMTFQIHGDGGKDFAGTWQIGNGTGAYANVKGGGTWIHTDLPTGDGLFTCTGQVHFDG